MSGPSDPSWRNPAMNGGRGALPSGRGWVPDPGASSPKLQALGAIREKVKLIPAPSALETGPTVVETDNLLSGLAHRGRLDVHVVGGKS